MFYDTHAHYDDKRIKRADVLIHSAYLNNVTRILNVGRDLHSSQFSVDLAKEYSFIYATVGVCPNSVTDIRSRANTLTALQKMLSYEKVVAVGECGLDYSHKFNKIEANYYRGWTAKDLQKDWFRLQLELGIRHARPMIVHCRQAYKDCLKIISEYPEARGVFHGFSGDAEIAQQLIHLGWYISFCGSITYKNKDAAKLREIMCALPQDKIMIETDCPFYAPHPMRGQANHSGFLHYTAQVGADLLGMSLQEFAQLTTNNARLLFGV
ncbi:MAG: TatD family hydrolase [Oscillospiraceae bacterium]|nr:TatD family hydrolase [Oscillospiraceae bacterium]